MMPPGSFNDFPLAEPILRGVREAGYTVPTPIQAQAIPILLQGRDLLGCAQTGTGKTAAFALPILHQLAGQKRHLERRQVRVLVLSPTRELALQIHESFRVYGKHLRLRTAVIFGGVSQNVQIKALSGGVDVLVATPGRLLDLMQQRQVNLSRLEVFVLDEADRMLDMGFITDIRKIITHLPEQRHTLLFSATMPSEIRTLAASLLNNAERVDVAPTAALKAQITQSVMYVERANKRRLLEHVLAQKDAKRVLVFTRTKHGANRIVEWLNEIGVQSDAIHGNKSQGARQRALTQFRLGRVRVLVATDVMARGIDVDDVTHVINFEIPGDAESYVHRIGRTGRASSTGAAISFCDSEERGFMRAIEKLAGAPIPIEREQPFHSEAAFLSKNNSQSLRRVGGQQQRGKGGGGGGGGGGGRHKSKFRGPRRGGGHGRRAN